MTPKQHLQNLADHMPDDVDLDEVFYRLELFIGVQSGLRDIDRGHYVDHDTLFDELLSDDEEKTSSLVKDRKKRPSGNKKDNRSGLTDNGTKLRKPVKRVRK